MKDLRQKTCCFSGHRMIPEQQRAYIEKRTKRYIRQLYKTGVRYFGVGGAIGYDTLAAECLFELRKKDLPDIKIILVYPFEGFTDRWTSEQKAQFSNLLPRYDKTVCVSKTRNKSAYLERNRRLVDGSAYCIVYCTKQTGGTAYTVQYAESCGVTVYNITQNTGAWQERNCRY